LRISRPLYPYLLLTHFFLHLYGVNLQQGLSVDRLVIPFVTSAVVLAALWWFLNLITKDVHRSGFLAAVVVLVFYSFGHVHGFISQFVPIRYGALLVAYGLFLAGSLYLTMKWPDAIRRITPTLNVFALILLMMALFVVVASKLADRAASSQLAAPGSADVSGTQKPAATPTPSDTAVKPIKPDIYYIVLDEYARDDVLRELFQYDNSDFTDFLRERGFYVAEKSHCNYPRTPFSLGSTLNMTHLDDLAETMGPQTATLNPLYDLIRDNEVARVLKERGYGYFMTDSGLRPTRASQLADVVISSDTAGEFEIAFFNATLLKTRASQKLAGTWRQRHLYNLEQVARIAADERITFTFAHMMLPHPPFVFDREGAPAEAYEIRMTPDRGRYLPPDPKYRKLYLDQLIYTNKLIKPMIDQILAASPEPPVIVLQSDHGSWPASKWEPSANWLKERMPILNAYHLPGDGASMLYDSITPVNTFRVILDYYFGTSYGLLEDKIYYSHPHDSPYALEDVSDTFRASSYGPSTGSTTTSSAPHCSTP